MMYRRSGNGHLLDIRIGKNGIKIACESKRRVGFRQGRGLFRVGFANGVEATEVVEIPGEVPAPIAAADKGQRGMV